MPVTAAAQADQMLEGTERALGQLLGGAPEIAQDAGTETAVTPPGVSITGVNAAGSAEATAIRDALSALVSEAQGEGTQDGYLSVLAGEAANENAGDVLIEQIPADTATDTAALLKDLVDEAGQTAEAGSESPPAQTAAAAGITEAASSGEAEAQQDRFVTVRAGETLSVLARRYYNDPFAFPRIYDANRDVLSNPNILPIGSRLRIPY